MGQLTNQLGQVIRSQSVARRLMLLVLMCGSMAGLIWIGLIAKNGSYSTILSNLSPQDASDARVKLAGMGISVKTENGGATLLVPARRAEEANMGLALEGIPSAGTMGMEGMDKSQLGQNKFQQEKNYHRMREGELQRTLETLQEIEKARVAIAKPEESLFVKDQKQPTAAVMLKLRGGRQLSQRQLTGIVHLISHSVEGLQPENVSIVDNLGNQLNSTHGEGGMATGEATVKTAYESRLKADLETLLENTVGRGKVAVRVAADFDFTNQHEVTEDYLPDAVVKSEQISLESKKNAANSPTGSGSDTNVPGSAAAPADGAPPASPNAPPKSGPEQERNESTKEYAISRKWKETQSSIPVPKRVSVAVLVDGKYVEATGKDGKKTEQFQMRTAEELKTLQTLVEGAIGYTKSDEEGGRQDIVKVECLPFKVEETELPQKTWLTYQMRQMIELGVTWGVVGLIGLLLIFKVLHPAMKQITVARVAGKPALLPAGGVPPEAMGAEEGSDSAQAMALLQRFRDAMPAGTELPPEMLQEMKQLEGELGAKNIAFTQKMHMSQMQAKSLNAQSQKVHKDVIESAKQDPQRTVSLLRQWMDEA